VVDIYIGIGSNIEPHRHIKQAIESLSGCFPSIKFSRVFESQAIGFEGDNFLNLVALFNSDDLESLPEPSYDPSSEKTAPAMELELLKLVSQLKQIENDIGRARNGEKFSARNIDIDILLFGGYQCDSPIELPRQEIFENAYVLWPLSELSPRLTLPKSEKTYTQCWREFDQSSQVLKPVSFDF
jgi:2-amino-4-hydroxy-6-hydroxymethyldihydropteridine diphosphokinase